MVCCLQDICIKTNLVANRFYLPKYLLAALLTFIIVGLGSSFSGTHAAETRHHEAHEHGVAHLNIAIEGNNVIIEFTSPAANIVGFEHHPRTQKQKDAVKNAVKKLKEGNVLFLLSADSKSRLAESRVDTDIGSHEDHESESEHAHEKEGHHGEDEGHHGKEAKHDEEHSDADDHERHSEFEAKYHFVCKAPNKLSQIDVQLFQVFPGIEHIEVQLINETRQTGMELTAQKNKIAL